jgi:CRISPR/Cas system CSM-associated protein Csm3 (group 7 of RAMP superfamily)
MCPHHTDKNKPLICDVCQLFGGPSDQSRLFFSDAVAKFPDGTEIGEEDARFTTRVQAGVSISRKRRTAEDERLYYMERGVEGLIYEGTIDGYLDDNLAEQQSALLISAVGQLVAVGGSKSRGAGWISARVSSVAFDDKLLSGEEIRRIREEGLKAWRESK